MPFTLTLSEGRKLPVIHNEFLSFFPSGRAAMLTHGDDRFTLIDLLLVTSVDVDPQFRTPDQGCSEETLSSVSSWRKSVLPSVPGG